MKRLPLLLILLLAACSYPRVAVDYDPATEFGRFHTWTWAPDAPGSVEAEQRSAQVSPFTRDRARAAVEAVLLRKGFMRAADRADFAVAIHFSSARRFAADPAYYGWSWSWGYGWGPGWYGHWGYPGVYSYRELPLTVDVYEAAPSGKLVWWGVAKGTMDDDLRPEEQSELIAELVDAVLARFPPPRKR